MVILYYKIFKAIHDRAKKAIGSRKTYSSSTSDTTKSAKVIENISQTKRFREEIKATDDSGKPSINNRLRTKLPLITETDAITNTGSGGSHDEDEEEEDKDEMEMVECHVIKNKRAEQEDYDIDGKQRKHNKSVVQLQSPIEVEVTVGPNGNTNNTDSGYAPSNAPSHIEECSQFCLQNPNTDSSPTDKTLTANTNKSDAAVVLVVQNINKNGNISAAQLSTSSTSPNAGLNHIHHPKHSDSVSHSGSTTGSTGAAHTAHRPAKKKSRFNLGRKTKSTRKKREKASAKRERKATKTLAIVLGIYCFDYFFKFLRYFSSNLTTNTFITIFLLKALIFFESVLIG